MKRVKPKVSPNARAAVRLQGFVPAYETAVQSVEHLHQTLPDADAAIKLNRLFVLVADALREQISRSEGPDKGDSPRSMTRSVGIDVDVIAAIVRITDALVDRAHSDLPALAPLMGHLTEWPVIAGVDPSRDSRQVVKYPGGAAAMRYKPVNEYLGRMRFFPGKTLDNDSIFRQIAADAAQYAYVLNLSDWRWKEFGLPGVFEFEDSKGSLQKPHIEKPAPRSSMHPNQVADLVEVVEFLRPRGEQQYGVAPENPQGSALQFDARSSATALKYYLY